MNPVISLCDSTPRPVAPIDRMQDLVLVDATVIKKNIEDQIEYISSQFIQTQEHPYFKLIVRQALEASLNEYVRRRYIEPNYEVELYESFTVVNSGKGAAIIWKTKNGYTIRQEFSAKTALLHAVGRHAIRRMTGVVVFRAGFYQKQFAHFTFCDYI